jgi:hypothetical protein
LLAFTSVYFSESGLFKGLRPIQIKKIAPSILGCRTDGSSRVGAIVSPNFRSVAAIPGLLRRDWPQSKYSDAARKLISEINGAPSPFRTFMGHVWRVTSVAFSRSVRKR